MPAIQAMQLAAGKLYGELLHQSAIISFADAFGWLSILMLGGAIICLLFMPNNDPRAKKAVAPAH